RGRGVVVLHARPVDDGARDRLRRRRHPWRRRSPPPPRVVVRLFLFDIDGTLVTARGAGRTAIGRALTEVYGTTGPIDAFDFRGRTDPQIVFGLMRAAGLGDERITAGLAACFAAYVRELEAIIGDGRRVQVMPGMPEVLKRLD